MRSLKLYNLKKLRRDKIQMMRNMFTQFTGKDKINSKYRWVLAIASIGMIAVIIAIVFAGYFKQEIIPPYSFFGEWITSNSKYKDRFFELTEVTITFGVGGDKINVYFILSIEKDTQDNTYYTISYRNLNGMKFKTSFYYDPEKEDVIRFKNQMDVEWVRNMDWPFD